MARNDTWPPLGLRAWNRNSPISSGWIWPPDHVTAVMRPVLSLDTSFDHPRVGTKRDTSTSCGNSTRTATVGTLFSVGTRTVYSSLASVVLSRGQTVMWA